jgi:electron transport complex protein RnfG
MFKWLKKSFIVQAWLVLILALLFGAALASVKIVLEPMIVANKVNEIRQKLPEIILGAEAAQQMAKADQQLVIETRSVQVEKKAQNIAYRVYEARNPDQTLKGWVVKTGGQGYADKIELLLGLGPLAESITGIFILDQKETPGLGSQIIAQKWRNQFINKNTSESLIPVKDGADAANEIDAITGATISSRSVCDIINAAASDLRKPLAAMAIKDKPRI